MDGWIGDSFIHDRGETKQKKMKRRGKERRRIERSDKR